MNRRAFLTGGAATVLTYAAAEARLRVALMAFKPSWWKQFGATAVLYVSNVANNGYGLGNDSTGNGTKAAPYLTPQKAQTVASSSIVTAVEINPSGTIYTVDSGSGYLSVLTTKSLVFGSDPIFGVKPILQGVAATGARVVLFGTSAKTYVLYNLVIDGTGTTSGNLVTQSNQTGGVSLINCNFRNSSASAIIHPTLTGNIQNVAGCNFESTCHFVLSGSGGAYATLALNGNTFAQDNQTYQGAVGGSVTNFIVNGNTWVQNGVGTSKGITIAGETIGTLTFNDNSATGTFASSLLSINDSSIITSWIANGNSGNPSAGMILNNSENIVTGEIAFNNLNIPVGVSDQIVSRCVPGVFNVHDNVVSIAATATQHGISIGNDGYITDSSNSTATTTQKMGDLATNTYIGQKITMGVAAQALKASNLATVLVTLAKAGSPTGTITCGLYTDNSGAPGTLLDTSSTTLSAASLGGTAGTWGFTFPNHYLTTPGGTYWYVMQYTGTNDTINYVNVSTNTTVTNGSLSTSALGVVWSNDAIHAGIYTIFTGSFAGTVFNVYKNKIYVQPGANTVTHGLLIGACNLTAYYRNEVYNSAICHLFKNTYAAAGAGFIYDNIGTSTIGAESGLYWKGSQGLSAYQNTLVCTSATAGSAGLISSTDSANGLNAPQATGNFKNNIVVSTGAGTAYAVDAGSAVVINFNCVFSAGNINTVGGQTTWAGWQGAGFDTNSVNSNPNLPSAATSGSIIPTDFIPPHTSPAAGIGTNLQSIVANDFGGAAFSTTPPAGAWNVAA